MSETAHLRVIDCETGEVIVNGCPRCSTNEAVVVQYEKDIRKLKAQITRLERDKEAEARRHKLWDEASALHDWWGMATGHAGTKFGADELHQALPRLKERTPVEVLQGIAGIAYDPNTKQTRNGGTERYDSWELLLKSGPNLQRYMERAYQWPSKEHQWKFWLIERIEGSFK